MTANQSITPVSYAVSPEGQATLAGIPLTQLAQSYGTPLYVLDAATITAVAQAYTQTLTQHYPAPHRVLYASKANLNVGLAKFLASLGLGFDVVSGGELATVLAAGVDPKTLCFNGNNKSSQELDDALAAGVGRITVDNPDELTLLVERIRAKRLHQPNFGSVPILLRVTPGIDCHTHHYIRTGQVDSKFGFNVSDILPTIQNIIGPWASELQLCGLQAHIGSQIFEHQAYLDLVGFFAAQYDQIRAQTGLVFTDLNVGGGIGVAYTATDDPLAIDTTVAAIAKAVVNAFTEIAYPLPRLLMEPGRSLIATAGMTLYTVGGQKHIPFAGLAPDMAQMFPQGRTYWAVDGGMGDNIRPALYQAQYTAVVANKANLPATTPVTIAGKYCESGDILFPAIPLPPLERGDTLAVMTTGAYNYSMASAYNRMPRAAMVLVNPEGTSAEAVQPLVRRETAADMLAQDVI